MLMAMYKGPPAELLPWVGHVGVCLRTLSPYSHVELAFGGIGSNGHSLCWSSSSRDGGVRSKEIQLTSGRWDVFTMPGMDALDEACALNWFEAHKGAGYDWAGNAGFVLPWRTESRSKFFCSEACAAALALARPWTYHPAGLLQRCTLEALQLDM